MISKKTGILTFSHLNNMNYGAMLQAFALYTILKRIGVIPYIIDWKIRKSKKIYGLRKKLSLYKFKLNKFGTRILSQKHFKNFSDQYLLNKTEKVTISNIKQLNNTLDTFIVGSDQVWRYRYCPDINTFFLKFVNDKNRKIAYAASFGTDKWNEAPETVTQNIKNLLNRFNKISVREKSGIHICETKFDFTPKHVLDPTLLLTGEDYIKLLHLNEIYDGPRIEQNYISCMLLDNNKSFIKKLSNHSKLKVINIMGKQLSLCWLTFFKFNSFSKWLNYIRFSKFVVTDSFHATVFCILFKKRFVVLTNKKRGIARLDSLLSILDLKNKLFTDENDLINSDMWNIDINYKHIDALLSKERKYSMEFLLNALK